MLSFVIDTLGKKMPFKHYWEKCVGSCHAYTALRADYQEQLARAHKDCGFEYVRFHGLLDDDMSVVARDKSTGELRFCFFNIDTIFDFLLNIGMKPFIELGFMPGALASSQTTCFNYKGNISMPKDYGEWGALITALVQHLIERYGISEVRSWFFELWNEPNLSFFFEGSQSDYFTLYNHTANAIKKIDTGLLVGGPATSNNAWIPQFIDYCKGNRVPLDFISTHHYPSDDPLWRNDNLGMDEFARIVKEKGHAVYERGVLKEMTLRAKEESGGYPLYYTEWNSSAMIPDTLHDESYSAALAVKTIIDNISLVDVYSFWTFTDIFEENGQLPGEFHGGFGLQTVHGIPKPTYHAFEFLHRLGSNYFPIPDEQGTVGMIATEQNNGVAVIAYNHQVIDEPIANQSISLTLLNHTFSRAELILVDEMQGNAHSAWKKMGSLVYPTAAMITELREASQIQPICLLVANQGGNTVTTFPLPKHSIAFIRLY